MTNGGAGDGGTTPQGTTLVDPSFGERSGGYDLNEIRRTGSAIVGPFDSPATAYAWRPQPTYGRESSGSQCRCIGARRTSVREPATRPRSPHTDAGGGNGGPTTTRAIT